MDGAASAPVDGTASASDVNVVATPAADDGWTATADANDDAASAPAAATTVDRDE